jgi:hypothetical protein
MRKLAGLALIGALPYVAGAQDKVEDETARLKERVEALEAALYPRGRDQAAITADMALMRNLAGLLVFSQFPMQDGALDVYRVVGKDAPDERRLELFRSHRTGVGPSRAEVQKGDYTHFPYERFRGDTPPKGSGDVPLFWDRVAQLDGTRLVALANGAAKRMQEADLLALLERCGQSNIRYSKNGVSFTFPRRFQLVESQRGPVLVSILNDPVTRNLVFLAHHGKHKPQYFAAFYAGLKSGLKVATVVEQTQIKEKIGNEEVTGTKLVYLAENDPTKQILRYFTVQEACTIAVRTAQAKDAFAYRKLRSILRSVALPEAGSD